MLFYPSINKQLNEWRSKPVLSTTRPTSLSNPLTSFLLHSHHLSVGYPYPVLRHTSCHHDFWSASWNPSPSRSGNVLTKSQIESHHIPVLNSSVNSHFLKVFSSPASLFRHPPTSLVRPVFPQFLQHTRLLLLLGLCPHEVSPFSQTPCSTSPCLAQSYLSFILKYQFPLRGLRAVHIKLSCWS